MSLHSNHNIRYMMLKSGQSVSMKHGTYSRYLIVDMIDDDALLSSVLYPPWWYMFHLSTSDFQLQHH